MYESETEPVILNVYGAQESIPRNDQLFLGHKLSHVTAQVGSLRGGDCEWEGDPGQHDPGWHGSRLLFPGPGHKNESNNKYF